MRLLLSKEPKYLRRLQAKEGHHMASSRAFFRLSPVVNKVDADAVCDAMVEAGMLVGARRGPSSGRRRCRGLLPPVASGLAICDGLLSPVICDGLLSPVGSGRESLPYVMAFCACRQW